ncbi:MAG: hypothetical protein QNJ36_23020 [Calothrix sp. MO_167.B42]|nr:hypothetical protein [Calothrix sp. MO_167.B42]
MPATKLSISLNTILTSFLNLLVSQSKKAKARVYDYTRFTSGQDYVFEAKEDGIKGYITAQFSGVQSGDYIILIHGSHKRCYQVEEIDYYSEPADMWMALLRLVEDYGV